MDEWELHKEIMRGARRSVIKLGSSLLVPFRFRSKQGLYLLIHS